MKLFFLATLLCFSNMAFADQKFVCENPVCNVQSECVSSLSACQYEDTYLNSDLYITYKFSFQVKQQRTCFKQNGQVSGTNYEIRTGSERAIYGLDREEALLNAASACKNGQQAMINFLGSCQ